MKARVTSPEGRVTDVDAPAEEIARLASAGYRVEVLPLPCRCVAPGGCAHCAPVRR